SSWTRTRQRAPTGARGVRRRRPALPGADLRICGNKECEMAASKTAELIRGRTIRFVWTDGPTKGSTHEHVFHDDGTVEWHAVAANTSAAAGASNEGDKRPEPAERPRYSAAALTDHIWLISYLASSGFTLTVALNFADSSLVGFASNDKS